MKNISNNVIAIGIAGVVVGLVIGWFLGGMGDDSRVENFKNIGTVNTENNGTKNMPVGSSELTQNPNTKISDALFTDPSLFAESESVVTVEDQFAASTATVASAETDSSVWVVVREDKNGIIGNILGAARVGMGTHSNVSVPLLRPTVAGQTYRVVLFRDNGDGTFDYKIDTPLTANGTVISSAFRAL